jgi:hypothetical protein
MYAGDPRTDSDRVSSMQQKMFGWPVAVFLFMAAEPLVAARPRRHRDPVEKHVRKQRSPGRRPEKVRAKARRRLPGTQHK